MPDWKPILLAPFLAVVGWFVAHNIAGSRGAPEGDTGFAWLQLMALTFGLWWLLAAGAILIVRAVMLVARPGRSVTVARLAIATNVIAVAFIYGPTMQSISEDEGWPDDPIAVGALVLAGLVSLLPVAWIWQTHRDHGDRLSGRAPG
ncbi:MAG: hypothetical protein M5T61_15205 [Acidimicrobiia bacterium]|nr:hypothetical protein [Acidimicrobiia bacterium]